MIRIPYDELGKLNFQQTVQKLANSPLKDPVAFQIKHMTKALREGFFAMREEYQKEIEDKFALKVEGKVDVAKDGSKAAELKLPFAVKEGTEGDVKGLLDTFSKKELKIDRKKIPHEVLFRCNEWTPRELEALEFIVDEPGDPV